MKFITNEDLLNVMDSTVGILAVVPGEEEAGKLIGLIKKVNKQLADEGNDFKILPVEGEFKEEEMLDKIPVFFMLEKEYLMGTDEQERGLIRLIPLGMDESAVMGSKALDERVWKWTAWKLWQVKMGQKEAIDVARRELGKIEMGEAD